MFDINNYNVLWYQNPSYVDNIINNSHKFNSGIRAVAGSIFQIYFNLMKSSVKHDKYFDKKRNAHYVIFTNEAIHQVKHYSANAINKAKKLLGTKYGLGLIKFQKQGKNRPYKIFIPSFKDIVNKMNNRSLAVNQQSSLLSSNSKITGQSNGDQHYNNISKTKSLKPSNTVNTEKPQNSKLKFVRMDRYTNWMDSTQHQMGLTKDAVYQVAKFASTYNLSAHDLGGYIKEARNTVAHNYHLSPKSKLTRFECNINIVNNLGNKLSKLFTDIINKHYRKASLNNYIGFFINSLEHFFEWCFGLLKPNKTVKPKVSKRNDYSENGKYTVITNNQGQVVKRIKNPKSLMESKPDKLHPTSPKLVAKIKKQLANM